MKAEIWVPVISAAVSGIFLLGVARISRSNKPVSDVLKKTKIEGNGSLIEALTALSKENSEMRKRHSEELAYFTNQVSVLRGLLSKRDDKIATQDDRIEELEAILRDHETRLNEGHVGSGK